MSNYGVPQRRSRVIIVGLREDYFGDAEAILDRLYSKKSRERIIPYKEMVTVKDAIGDLPKIYPLKKPFRSDGRRYSHTVGRNNAITKHDPRFHNLRDIETFRILAEDLQEGTELYNSVDAIKNLYTERTGKVSNVHKYHVIRPNQPGNTIPAHLYKDGLRHIHWDPEQARTITVREAACIQDSQGTLSFQFQWAQLTR